MALVAVAFSPLLRVQSVVWTGHVPLSEPQYRAFETAALGRPLLLLSDRTLLSILQLDAAGLRLRLYRHPPHTLEARLEPRLAVARLADGAPLDSRGRVLPARHAVPGLPQLVGFGLTADGRELESSGRRLLEQLRPVVATPGLTPSEVARRGDDVEIQIADSGTRVRMRVDRLESQLAKLRILQQSLGSEPLPASVDLRFRDQIVVRGAAEEVHASRRRH